jgi:hypothetical protein
MDIYLKKAILSIVDRQSDTIIPSFTGLDLTKEYVRDFLIAKIAKVSSAKAKTGQLAEDAPFGLLAKQVEKSFEENNNQLFNYWYEKYSESEAAPSCDFIVALYEEDTQLYLAVLKINYQTAYTHFVAMNENGSDNQLVLNQAILGSKTAKPDEGLLLNLETLTFELIEKAYVFSGEKKLYFSEEILQLTPTASLDDQVNLVKKAAEKISQEYNEESFQVVADVKEAFLTSFEETGQIDEEKIVEEVFKENISARLAFKEELHETGFVPNAPLTKEAKQISQKKFNKQKFKMSNGIELIVPTDVFKNADLIEFVNNPDGTISVMIKNVEEVINKL